MEDIKPHPTHTILFCDLAPNFSTHGSRTVNATGSTWQQCVKATVKLPVDANCTDTLRIRQIVNFPIASGFSLSNKCLNDETNKWNKTNDTANRK